MPEKVFCFINVKSKTVFDSAAGVCVGVGLGADLRFQKISSYSFGSV
jgi:hypothetical protein